MATVGFQASLVNVKITPEIREGFDFTAAQILIEFIEHCAQSKIRFAVARLQSVRAGEPFERLGITDAEKDE